LQFIKKSIKQLIRQINKLKTTDRSFLNRFLKIQNFCSAMLRISGSLANHSQSRMLERACFARVIFAKLHQTVVPNQWRDRSGDDARRARKHLSLSTWLKRYKNGVIRRCVRNLTPPTEPQNRSHWLTLHHRGCSLHFRRLHATWRSADHAASHERDAHRRFRPAK